VRVVVAGLDRYLRRPFGPMPGLLALAEEVDRYAVCGAVSRRPL
jgi:thymidine kinase